MSTASIEHWLYRMYLSNHKCWLLIRVRSNCGLSVIFDGKLGSGRERIHSGVCSVRTPKSFVLQDCIERQSLHLPLRCSQDIAELVVLFAPINRHQVLAIIGEILAPPFAHLILRLCPLSLSQLKVEINPFSSKIYDEGQNPSNFVSLVEF